jgi:hypothetical protein
MGNIDYTSRLAADVLKTTYLGASALSESRLYFRLVWGMVVLGVVIILAGFNQPLVLLVISACTGGVMMCVYAILLAVLNATTLPAPIAPTRWRIAVLLGASAFFGWLSVLMIRQQLG